ncbi:MAG: hypothetical protein Q7S49_02070 [bacterium]|nr:hypothetical protein [bacterium]
MNIKERFAVDLRQLGMFKDKNQSPGGKGFRLKLHESQPDAPLSPYYIDLRALRSHPTTAKITAVDLFEEMIDGFAYDVFADVPTAITPVVSSLSDRLETPMVTPRATKGHGSGGNIDGAWFEEDIALLFDDLVTGAHSKIEAARVLRAGGIEVRHVFVLLDREQGGNAQLKTEDLALHAAFTISELLRLYHEEGTISPDLYEEIQAYRAAQ